MKNIFSFGLVFLFLFIPFVRFAGITIPSPYLFSLSLLFFLLLNMIFNNLKINIFLLETIFIILALLSLVFFNGMVHSYLDTEITMLLILGINSVLCSYIIAIIYIKIWREQAAIKIVEHIFYSCSLHALIMVTSFFITPLSDILYKFVVLSEVGQRFVDMGVRSPGLTGSGGDHLSVIQGIGLIFGLQLCINENISYKKMIFYFLLMFLLIISILLSARTGLVIVSFSFLMLLWLNFDFKTLFFKIKIKTKVFKFSLILVVIFIVSLFILYTLLKDSEYVRLFNRSFEFLLQYYETGEFTTRSTEVMKNMYFLPSELNVALFGSGDFGRNLDTSGYLDSDIGLVRLIFGFGFFGAILLFSSLFILVKKAVSKSTILNLKVLSMTVFFVILIFNFKVLHIYGNRESFKVLFLIIFVSVLLSSRPINHAR